MPLLGIGDALNEQKVKNNPWSHGITFHYSKKEKNSKIDMQYVNSDNCDVRSQRRGSVTSTGWARGFSETLTFGQIPEVGKSRGGAT
jgi:hypothetical protein